jgi:hypothetical protein
MAHITLAVVIPSTLGPQLIDTVNSIAASSYNISEIIVVYPQSASNRLESFTFIRDLVRFIPSDISSQVYQRYLGFQRTSSSLVLQSDDDVIYQIDTISTLVSSLLSLNNTSSCIAPCFYSRSTGFAIHRISPFARVLYKNLCGLSTCHGKITPFSTSYGVDPEECSPTIHNLFESDWLPGGCVLHHSSNITFSLDSFPFEGKAYCEDLIDSFCRSTHGIKHYVCLDSSVFIDPIMLPSSFLEILHDFRARYYFATLSSRSRPLLLSWAFVSYGCRLIWSYV